MRRIVVLSLPAALAVVALAPTRARAEPPKIVKAPATIASVQKPNIAVMATAATECKLVYNGALKNTVGPLLTNKLSETFPAGTKVDVTISDGKKGSGKTQSDSGGNTLYSNILGIQWTWPGNVESKYTCKAILHRQADLRLGSVVWKAGAANTVSVTVTNAGGLASGKFKTKVREVKCNGNSEVVLGTKEVEMEVGAHGSATADVPLTKHPDGKLGAKADVSNQVDETQEDTVNTNLCAPEPPH